MRLQNDRLLLHLAPDVGAGVLAFESLAHGPLMAPSGGELGASSFLMVPYSNRVADGAFTFHGRRVRLDEPERHAIHGVVRKRPWEVVSATATAATLRYRHGGGAWPWPFLAEVDYALDGASLVTRLRVRNLGDDRMPAGLGFHPYFVREDAVVGFRVAGIYPDAHGTRIPSGPASPPDPGRDFSTPRALDPDAFMDFCAHGWDGRATIAWPGRGIGLDVRSDLGHLVFYNPPAPWFALEPVSNANDGFNLFARGDATSGVRVLAPGEGTAGEMVLTLRAP
ncbi:MAG: aldose 1-epimerase [Myxococcota bacterium]